MVWSFSRSVKACAFLLSVSMLHVTTIQAEKLKTVEVLSIIMDGEYPTVEKHRKDLFCKSNNFHFIISQLSERAWPSMRFVSHKFSISLNGKTLKQPDGSSLIAELAAFTWTGTATAHCGNPAIVKIGLEMIDDNDASTEVCEGKTYRTLELEIVRRKIQSAVLSCVY
jgi:hypothetical protein